MPHFVNANNLAEAYVRILNLVMHKGENEIDSRDDYVKEILNLTTTINDPFELNSGLGREYLTIPKELPWNREMLGIYEEQFINPVNDGFIYTYGERLRNWDGHDQISELIDELNHNQTSRRAVAVTWNADLDAERDEVPCLQFVQFHIRHGVLHCTALWRSHDILGAWYVNLIGLRHLMKYVYENLTDKTVKLGTITVHSVSAHIRYDDFDTAENIIEHNRSII